MTWNEKPIRCCRKSALTLIELIAVLVLCAVLAGIVVVSVRSHVARANLTSSCEMLMACDSHARHVAHERGQPTRLLIGSGDRATIRLPNGQIRTVARGVKIDRLWTARTSTQTGTLQVVMTANGQSETYAVRLTAGEKLSRWIMVLGGSGQTLVMKDERRVRRLLAIR